MEVEQILAAHLQRTEDCSTYTTLAQSYQYVCLLQELYRTLESFQEKNTERYADKMELASLTTDSVRYGLVVDRHSNPGV